MDTRIALQPAYVLHRRPFQNTSLLVDFFTFDYGLVRAVAKGARREKSRYRALLQLFQPLLVSATGMGEVKTLTAVESNVSAINLRGERLFSGLYINELLSRLLQNQEEHTALYGSYQETLVALQGEQSIEPLLRRFELKLLAELGYAINLTEDCETNLPINPDSIYRFIPDVGFQTRSLSGAAALGSSEFTGADLIAVRDLDIETSGAAQAAKRLLRLALAAHLGDKPLYSRSLFTASQ
jgi:DNA repair protein RecO (recombination protein O)